MTWGVHAYMLSHLSDVQLFPTPWTVARRASLPMEFSKQEYWSELPFSSPGDLPTQGLNPGLPSDLEKEELNWRNQPA